MKPNAPVFAATFALLVPLAGSAGAQEEVPLPDGEGQALVEVVCAQCHALRPIFLYNGGDHRWDILVHDMVALGAQLSPEERDTALKYLKASFSTDRIPSRKDPSLPPGKGQEVLRASCGTCHGVALITQKRADRAAWEQIIRQHNLDDRVKLVPEQEQVLLSYVSANFGRPAATEPK